MNTYGESVQLSARNRDSYLDLLREFQQKYSVINKRFVDIKSALKRLDLKIVGCEKAVTEKNELLTTQNDELDVMHLKVKKCQRDLDAKKSQKEVIDDRVNLGTHPNPTPTELAVVDTAYLCAVNALELASMDVLAKKTAIEETGKLIKDSSREIDAFKYQKKTLGFGVETIDYESRRLLDEFTARK